MFCNAMRPPTTPPARSGTISDDLGSSSVTTETPSRSRASFTSSASIGSPVSITTRMNPRLLSGYGSHDVRAPRSIEYGKCTVSVARSYVQMSTT